MSESIINQNIIFGNCHTGKDFEYRTVDFLRMAGFIANKTGANDGGIDIVAKMNIQNCEYQFYIQCKFYNRPLGKAPIQEAFTGTHFYGNAGKPVVITNNEVTFNARMYAKRIGVEIIADAEWEEIKEACISKKARNQHSGLMGIIISSAIKSPEYAKQAVMTEAKHIAQELDAMQKYKLQLQTDFDVAEECLKEAERLQLRSMKYQRLAFERQKKAVLANLEHG